MFRGRLLLTRNCSDCPKPTTMSNDSHFWAYGGLSHDLLTKLLVTIINCVPVLHFSPRGKSRAHDCGYTSFHVFVEIFIAHVGNSKYPRLLSGNLAFSVCVFSRNELASFMSHTTSYWDGFENGCKWFWGKMFFTVRCTDLAILRVALASWKLSSIFRNMSYWNSLSFMFLWGNSG